MSDTSNLNVSSSSDEQLFILNQIDSVPKFLLNERVFFNPQTKLLDRTYTYIYNKSKHQIVLPDIQRESLITLSLLNIRQLIVRIAVFYDNNSIIQICFGSGLLLNNKLILTCSHNFDAIEWEKKIVRYTKIFVCSLDPANETLFSLFNPSDDLIEAKIIRRGLIEDNISDYDTRNSNSTDLAILLLDKPMKDLSSNEYFDPKIDSSLSKSHDIPINSQLFLISYNGELKNNNDLNPYKYEKGFENATIDTLNFYYNVNYKSVSSGRLIQESSSYNQYFMHSCSTLRGSSGAVILDSIGRFAGIHIGIANSRKQKQDDIFFNKETFNKFLPVTSSTFRQFINESIIPNIDNDELANTWRFDSK